MFGVTNLSSIPLRATPSERAELVSQLLFGDVYTVEEIQDNWMKIRTCDCNYEGWMTAKLHNPLSDKEAKKYLNAGKYVVKDYLLIIQDDKSRIEFPVFMGSSFPYPQNGILKMGNSTFRIEIPEPIPTVPIDGLSKQQAELIQFAFAYLQTPYLWGGRTPAGIDCSGFSQIVYKSIGINIPRDASQQVHCGDIVDFMEESQVGDLAFFQNTEGNIVHVGIVCGPNSIIHSSGRVKIDMLDSTGIFSREQNEYTHFLRIIKRLIIK